MPREVNGVRKVYVVWDEEQEYEPSLVFGDEFGQIQVKELTLNAVVLLDFLSILRIRVNVDRNRIVDRIRITFL